MTIKTLLFSTLYPSSTKPAHGIFVETRLRELLKSSEVETKVVAPVPWFFSKHPVFGEYAKMAATPKREKYNNIDVSHPRYFLPPKIGMNIAPYVLARGALPAIRKLIAEGFDFDLIDAHYYYPDGVAAGILAKTLNKPFVVTARGTDLNLIPDFPRPRQLIVETAERAAASIGVCQALMNRLSALGANTKKLHTFRNGVDLQRFVPENRAQARTQLNLPHNARILISVGYLIERKGHHIAIDAIPRLPKDVQLFIIGEGPERERLNAQIKQLGLIERVHLIGAIPQAELKWWYSAADALLLCSSREGWANVLLESMACGTPVVATSIWGTPEVVSCTEAGQLMTDRTPEALVSALETLFAHYPERTATRRFAEQFSWETTTKSQLQLFQSIVHA